MTPGPHPVGGDALKAFRQALARAHRAEQRVRELKARIRELENTRPSKE